MPMNLDYALATARAAELQNHVHEARGASHGSLADRLRRRREAARRARARHASRPRLKAA